MLTNKKSNQNTNIFIKKKLKPSKQYADKHEA
jgi:hypothetical protein